MNDTEILVKLYLEEQVRKLWHQGKSKTDICLTLFGDRCFAQGIPRRPMGGLVSRVINRELNQAGEDEDSAVYKYPPKAKSD